MQPYFLPYIGYWQLIAEADVFIVYDNIQYTKKGWINRNRFLLNGEPAVFTVPLKKDSDSKDVRERSLASDFQRGSLVNQLKGAYGKAPFFSQVLPLVESIIRCEEQNLFTYILSSIRAIAGYLGVTTPIVISSTVAIDHALRKEDKVIALCKASGATEYVNPIGGLELYANESFAGEGIALKFIKALPIAYAQFTEPFVPSLSIVDVLMFNNLATIRGMLGAFTLLSSAPTAASDHDGGQG